MAKRRSIIELSCDQARSFLLKEESYCEIELPRYFQFANLIQDVAKVLKGKLLSDFKCGSPRDYDDVNHLIMNNKDGRYAWRPLELIHPALYVSLVDRITEHDNWKLISERFEEYRSDARIKCLSVPVESLTEQKDNAEQINRWWMDFEQKSIELALNYELLIRTDVVDCYAAFYTHSIAWALHGKQVAKQNRNDKTLVGNIIDGHIQDMRHGQTNGIPQGSVLMHFIAEMILGYSDIELSKRIDHEGIKDFKILRYRDDYRIFVNNRPDGERILRCLTEVMIELGLKLNEVKTSFSDNVIQSSIKEDKLRWLFRRHADRNLQKHLLIIHDHSIRYPNAGSLRTEMFRFHRRFVNRRKYKNPLPLISIVVDIAFRNPRTYIISATILSKLLSLLKTTSRKKRIIKEIREKFSQIPNTGHLELWLQRITYPFDSNIDFEEPLCRLVRGEKAIIWNQKWINSKKLKKALDAEKVVNRKELDCMPDVVPPIEVEIFIERY